jgi:hypothetical protein
MGAFQPLEKIVEALRDCPDPDNKRQWNGYKYKDCPNSEMKSEILGANFRVDAAISNPDIYKTETGVIPFAAAQTAVVMEFKKGSKGEDVSNVSVTTLSTLPCLTNSPESKAVGGGSQPHHE